MNDVVLNKAEEKKKVLKQPKPETKKYTDLISEIQKGVIKIPKFQRDFVWSIDKTSQLLDSILKGYPIGTFILWETAERINDIKEIGNLAIPEASEGAKVQYVLDGQQRITSLYAAFLGAKIQKTGEKKVSNYREIYVDLTKDPHSTDEQIITSELPENRHITLSDVLNLQERLLEIQKLYTPEEFQKIYDYSRAFDTYEFSTVLLRKDDIESAIEVFTRINTGGQTLTLFEIMSAKTYDEKKKFDMQVKWTNFTKRLKDKKYDEISSSVILSLISILLSKTKECKRKVILNLDKNEIIDTWDSAISAIEDCIDYFKTTYRIPVSRLLPYDFLIVPFAYFFHKKNDKPSEIQRKYLEEYFWRASLSQRYSSATESKLAADIKKIELILQDIRPEYAEYRVDLSSPQALIDTNFSAGNSYCKAILCLLAYQEPKDFQDNGKVILDNSWLKVASSKNYHHFFPKAYLKQQKTPNANSLMNITFVSDHLNKKKIRAKSPAIYINEFKAENSKINTALKSHFIELTGYGIESNDYGVFLSSRANDIFTELDSRINLGHSVPATQEVHELILKDESETIEFKSTLRYDIRNKIVNKTMEHSVAKTIAAFMNTDGGVLIIGLDDDKNILGLENDINTLGKKNLDGFRLKLIEIIKNYIGAENSSHIKMEFPEIEELNICIVKVAKSSKPIFLNTDGKEEFYKRLDCSSQTLTRAEQSVYEKIHWG